MNATQSRTMHRQNWRERVPSLNNKFTSNTNNNINNNNNNNNNNNEHLIQRSIPTALGAYIVYNNDHEDEYIYANIRENTGHHRTSSKAISKTRCWTYKNKANNTMNMHTRTHTHKYNA